MLAAAFAFAALATVTTAFGRAAAPNGVAPPEYTPQSDSWPGSNYDLANSRATTQTTINSKTVSKLHRVWQFKIPGTSASGVFATTPIVEGGVVYFQDLNSNVYALDEQTGKLKWKHTFASQDVGPNGVSFGYGLLYGATKTSAFALNPSTGAIVWEKKLPTSIKVGIDIAPQVYDHKVLISTVPGSDLKHLYLPEADGYVYALDASTGKLVWKFNTLILPKTGAYSGGGLWYPPAVGEDGSVYLAVGNPGLPLAPNNPNASQRPGPNLYTVSMVVLDGSNGKLKWFRQTIPHDVRDYDLQLSMLYSAPSGQQMAIASGKMGKVYAWNAATGKAVWTTPVGKHLNDSGPLPKKVITVCPGPFGGVETPLAEANGTIFAPWLNSCGSLSATSLALGNFGTATGGLSALDANTGKPKWTVKLPHANFGAATVANDVVFTSDFSGLVYAYDTSNGNLLWHVQAPAGMNGFPAVAGDKLFIGAGTPGLGTLKKPVPSITAYGLG